MSMNIAKFFLVCIFSLSTLSHVKSTDNCGQLIQSNGSALNNANWPWLSSLFYYFNGQYFCSGTLISDRHILRAAHCFSGSNYSTPNQQVFVILGRTNFTEISAFEQIRNVTDIKNHQNWKQGNGVYDSDIALLTLSEPVVFTEFVHPICLPTWTKNSGPEGLKKVTQNGTIVGYKKSQENHQVQFYESHVENITTCLYGDETSCHIYGTEFTCSSVAGSGFYGQKNASSSYEINGLFSKGMNEGEDSACGLDTFVVFTFVGEYVDWIKSVMNAPFLIKSREGKQLKASTQIFCDYRWNYEQSNPFYTCMVRGLVVPSPYTSISSSILGRHGEDDSDSDVNRIHISKSKTIYLPDTIGISKKFPNVTNFWVSKSSLTFVERSKLESLKNLTTLCFNENEIEVFADDAFADLVNLEILWIYSNKINDLNEKLFVNLKKLRIIDARNNLLEFLPSKLFANNPSLKVINFSFNSLKNIEIDFTTFKSLKWMVLDGNECVSASYCKIFDCLKSIRQFQELVEQKC